MSADFPVFRLNSGYAFPLGAKPLPLEYQFLDENGAAIDMSIGTWTGQARAESKFGASTPANLGSGSVTVDTPTATVRYAWAEEDFATAGQFRLILWAGNGSTRVGSAVFEWSVVDAPGAAPTV